MGSGIPSATVSGFLGLVLACYSRQATINHIEFPYIGWRSISMLFNKILLTQHTVLQGSLKGKAAVLVASHLSDRVPEQDKLIVRGGYIILAVLDFLDCHDRQYKQK